MARPTVICVHGLWMRGLEMSYLRHRLREMGYPVRQFRYHSVASTLTAICARLRAFIQSQEGPVVLAGHSLGGVVCLHTLRRYAELPVDKAVCIASPLVDTSAGRSLYRRKAGRLILGQPLPEAVFQSHLGHWSGEPPVGVIAGTRSFGPGEIVTRLSKPNDGTVTVAETQLPGVADHLLMALSHTQLLFSRTVAEQCDSFFRTAEFMHD